MHQRQQQQQQSNPTRAIAKIRSNTHNLVKHQTNNNDASNLDKIKCNTHKHHAKQILNKTMCTTKGKPHIHNQKEYFDITGASTSSAHTHMQHVCIFTFSATHVSCAFTTSMLSHLRHFHMSALSHLWQVLIIGTCESSAPSHLRHFLKSDTFACPARSHGRRFHILGTCASSALSHVLHLGIFGNLACAYPMCDAHRDHPRANNHAKKANARPPTRSV